MNKIVILIFIIFLSGCSAKYPQNTNLALQINSQPGRIYSNGISATLKGHDARLDTAVVVYQLKGKPEIQIPNQTPPHIIVTEQLANGLQGQGLVFKNSSRVHIQLDINDLLVLVTRPKILYSTKAKSHLTLTIRNETITLTKTYDREANNNSATRPPVHELEKLLNDQLTDIINQILKDQEVQETINQRLR